MTENQKLREALSELIEAYNRAGPELSRAERAVDRMRLIAAHEALALPTKAEPAPAIAELPPYIYGREAGANEKVWTEQAVRAALRAKGGK